MLLNSSTVNTILQICEKAQRQALREFHSLHKIKIYKKEQGSVVSDADIRMERLIVSELQRMTPSHSILSEEAGHIFPEKRTADEYYEWVIDPIDGTNNFLHGHFYWGISIALKKVTPKTQEILAGAIAIPMLSEIYWAEKGKGAYLINANSQTVRIRVSNRNNLSECCFATSMHLAANSPSDALLALADKHSASLRICGATALDLAFLAAGKYDVVFAHNTKEWDMAAGIIIAQEAGAIICDYDNQKQYLQKLNFIATNESLSKYITKINTSSL